MGVACTSEGIDPRLALVGLATRYPGTGPNPLEQLAGLVRLHDIYASWSYRLH